MVQHRSEREDDLTHARWLAAHRVHIMHFSECQKDFPLSRTAFARGIGCGQAGVKPLIFLY